MRGATKLAARGLSAKTIFQSTLPMRGATHTAYKAVQPLGFQSTLPMRGATSLTGQPAGHRNISIHAPHAGSDHRRVEQHTGEDYFNPRSPCGERPLHGSVAWCENNFNPRSPCGERHHHNGDHYHDNQFQSTLPMRGATSPWCRR